MNIWARWFGSVTLVLCVVAVGVWLGMAKYLEIRAAMSAPPPPEMPVSVILSPVSEVTYRRQTSMIGTVLAPQSIMLSNEIAGTVSKIGFEPGDVVKENQILIELDTSVERAELQSAQARVRLAKSISGRMQQAIKSEAVTPAELEESQAMLDQAMASVAQLEAVIARKTLRAPFRGKIGLSNTHRGQFLPSGFQIASLQSLDDFVLVDFMLPKAAAEFIKTGDQIQLANADSTFPATITAVDSRADRTSRNLMARAKLAPVPSSLLPGDSVRVLVEYGPTIQTPAVPLEALRRAPMSTFVYVVQSDKNQKMRAIARTVQVGKTVGSRISVLHGIEISERVVADGSFKIRDGALIADAGSVNKRESN